MAQQTRCPKTCESFIDLTVSNTVFLLFSRSCYRVELLRGALKGRQVRAQTTCQSQKTAMRGENSCAVPSRPPLVGLPHVFLARRHTRGVRCIALCHHICKEENLFNSLTGGWCAGTMQCKITRTPDKVMYLLQLEACTGLPDNPRHKDLVRKQMAGSRSIVVSWCIVVYTLLLPSVYRR